jgi:hypothetical protein
MNPWSPPSPPPPSSPPPPLSQQAWAISAELESHLSGAESDLHRPLASPGPELHPDPRVADASSPSPPRAQPLSHHPSLRLHSPLGSPPPRPRRSCRGKRRLRSRSPSPTRSPVRSPSSPSPSPPASQRPSPELQRRRAPTKRQRRAAVTALPSVFRELSTLQLLSATTSPSHQLSSCSSARSPGARSTSPGDRSNSAVSRYRVRASVDRQPTAARGHRPHRIFDPRLFAPAAPLTALEQALATDTLLSSRLCAEGAPPSSPKRHLSRRPHSATIPW